MDNNISDQYWATEDISQLVAKLEAKVSDFDRYLDTSGRWMTWRDLYYNYYLVNEQNYFFPANGADGFKRLNINHFRAHLKHLLSLVTAQRVAPQPLAINSDYKSQAQTDFSKNILRYVEKEKGLEKVFENSTEMALLFGAAYISREWDATLGDVYGVDPIAQTAQHKGDFVVSMFNPIDCIFDFAGEGWDKSDWIVLRKYVNRWDLVAKFPAYAEQIKSMSIDPIVKRHRLGHVMNEQNDDLIPLYTFYHKKTSSVPQGRATLFLDSNTCLFDGAIPYKGIPVGRIVADEQINTPFPYSVSMDLLPVQKVYNALCSTICTNQAAFGVQNILIPKDSAINVTQLTEGLNAIYYDALATQGAKPEPLSLLATAPEVFRWIEYLESMMGKISGINDTVQGSPEASLKSGTALAFVASQAMVFISPLARSYNAIMEDTWTGILDILKEFATAPRMVIIAGLDHKAEVKEFTNQDLVNVDRVIVEAGNPLTQTFAFRMQMAETLLQNGLITKDEYKGILDTGEIAPLYGFEKAEILCIKASVEALQSGKQVKAMITDNHPMFIKAYLSILASPDARTAPDNPVMLNTLAAVQEHLAMWRTMDPALAAIINVPPAPPPPMQPGQGMPPQANGPQPGGPGMGGVTNVSGTRSPGGVRQPGMPQLPKGSPAVNQENFSKIQSAMPHPPLPQ